MFKVILLGDERDASLTLPILRCLAGHGGAIGCTGALVEYGETAPRFLLLEAERLESLCAENTVVVFKPSGGGELCSALAEKTVMLAEACDSRAGETAQRLSIPLVTCGMGAECDISLSSIGEKKAFVSIGRAILLPSGRVLEPCEFEVSLSVSPGSRELLFVCAVLILSECFIGYSIEI